MLKNQTNLPLGRKGPVPFPLFLFLLVALLFFQLCGLKTLESPLSTSPYPPSSGSGDDPTSSV